MRETGWKYVPKKMVVQVAVSMSLVVAANWMPPESQKLAREAGWSGTVLAVAAWLSKQGHRTNGNSGDHDGNGNS